MAAPISPLPLPTPDRTMPESAFEAAANNFLGALPQFALQANAQALDINNAGQSVDQALIDAIAQAGLAEGYKDTAITQASRAESEAGLAEGFKNDADGSASVAEGHAVTATNKVGELHSKYLGALPSDPTQDDNGDPVQDGAWYDNTSTDTPRIRRNGSWASVVFEVTGGVDPSELAPVAFSGFYTDLTQTPNLKTVATTGKYTDLTSRPTLGTAAAKDTSDLATAGQGGKADSALQPGLASIDDINEGTKKILTSAERTKLSGISTNATKNSTDAQLRKRADHTGDMPMGNVDGLSSALSSKADTNLSNVTPSLGRSALGLGAETTSTGNPTGGSNGDKWYKV